MTGFLIRSAMAGLMPSTAALPGVVDTGLREFVDRFNRECTWMMWLGVFAGSLLFAITPLLTIGVPLPAFWLSPHALDRHAHRVSGHRFYLLRSAVYLVKMMGAACWSAHPDSRSRLGLEPYPADPGTWRTS